MLKIFKVNVLHSLGPKKVEFLKNYFLIISRDGRILDLVEQLPKEYFGIEVRDFTEYLIISGFIDVHNHVPQFPVTGMTGMELLPWLNNYVFPQENKFKDLDVAKEVSSLFFKSLLLNGTTFTVSYSNISKDSTDVVFSEAKKSGIRAMIGKVMMDQNSPDFLIENMENSISDSVELIKKWHKCNSKIEYVLTPRFAITCTFELMKKISEIQFKYDTYVQSHLSENQNEVETTLKLFPGFDNYSKIYDRAGLLNEKSIMAHCIYLSDEEKKMIKKHKTLIAHCPSSNRFLESGIMASKSYIDDFQRLALGTDVAGGYSISIFNEMREALENSKLLRHFNSENKEILSVEEAFYMATLGGAEGLGKGNDLGNIQKGKYADFLVLDYMKIEPFRNISDEMDSIEILSKIIYRGDYSCIKNVYVAGEVLV